MKKGLSVLLIAAALFGFYGGATNLNDVLACKDYFTSASGASDDMQRLEDGLNQLKDNEQAYLDGQVALAEGEKTLADGYAALADGEAQYAAGLAAYKAAPGQLAAGEKALAEGKKSYADLNKLISGLTTAKKHGKDTTPKHDTYWHDGFSFDTYKDNGKAGLMPGRNYIVQTIKGMPTEVATIESLAGLDPGTISGWLPASGSYATFDKGAQKGASTLGAVEKTLAGFIKDGGSLYSAALPVYSAIAGISEGGNPPTDSQLSSLQSAAKALSASKYSGINGLLDQMTAEKLADTGFTYSQLLGAVAGGKVKAAVDGGNQAAAAAAQYAQAGDMETAQQYQQTAQQAYTQGATLAGAFVQLMAEDGEVMTTLGSYDKTLKKVVDTLKAWHDGYNTLDDGQKQLASKTEGIPFAFQNMVTNKTIKKAIKKYDPKLMPLLKTYAGTKGYNKLAKEDKDDFDKDIVKLSKKIIPRALNVLKKVKADANKQLAAGKAQLADGYKSYKEAPAKLADAEKQLADGRAQLADGEKQLEDGKAQLAQYEDGEQQVRDGLATLVGTDAMGNVQSIADRIGNDTDFDNGDKHLELDEGLSAVQAGKGYAADLTAAVTDEIMGRAVGTGLLIGAGVLAVLAALLSFLKKNKGAGVFAILAAAAGCVGAVMGNNAGMQFSSIAGSTMGATPWIAAGILAAVAAVHAVVHFAAKKAA